MRVIPPITVSGAVLTSSTVPEPATGEQVYNSATNYAVGARVISPTLHWEFQALTAGTDKPLPTTAGGSNANWASVGPTNRYRMFDLEADTASTGVSPLTVVLTPGQRVNALAVVGVVADEVTVTVTNDGVEVYSHTQTLRSRDTLTWSDYFFGDWEQTNAFALWDLPLYSGAVITVTFTRAGGDVSCGGLIVGRYEYLGEAQLGAESDALNFSSFDRTLGGASKIVRRRSVPKIALQVWSDKARVKRLVKLREELNAVPALWSWLDDADDDYFEAGLILGVYKRFLINAEHPNDAITEYEIEGF